MTPQLGPFVVNKDQIKFDLIPTSLVLLRILTVLTLLPRLTISVSVQQLRDSVYNLEVV